MHHEAATLSATVSDAVPALAEVGRDAHPGRMELDLEVLTVQATTRSIHLWFGPGHLLELPGRGPDRLPASTESV